jgi:hypothetical protein
MRRHLVGLVAVCALVATAYGTAPPPLPQDVIDTLGALDTAPTTVELNAAFMGSDSTTAAQLATVSTDDSNDIGVRLRAIHALGQYCPLPGDPPPCTALDPSHVALAAVITATSSANSGSQLLLLRAAVETIGPLAVSGDDTNLLVQLLNHPSRDIRASAANALTNFCTLAVENALRLRLQTETVDQVSLAITNALRVLASCSM